MAKPSKKKSTRGVIVQIFTDRLDLLKQKNNDEALKIYEERTGRPIDKRVRQSLSNVKSDLKIKGFTGNGGAVSKPTNVAPLEALEHAIDQCYAQALTINFGDDLHLAIEHLRTARRLLVRMILAGA
jgi:hypothetical protein